VRVAAVEPRQVQLVAVDLAGQKARNRRTAVSSVPWTCANDCENSATHASFTPSSVVIWTAHRPDTSALSVGGSSKKRHVWPSVATNGSDCRLPPGRSIVMWPSSRPPRPIRASSVVS
jgi:hypothetical protein